MDLLPAEAVRQEAESANELAELKRAAKTLLSTDYISPGPNAILNLEIVERALVMAKMRNTRFLEMAAAIKRNLDKIRKIRGMNTLLGEQEIMMDTAENLVSKLDKHLGNIASLRAILNTRVSQGQNMNDLARFNALRNEVVSGLEKEIRVLTNLIAAERIMAQHMP